MELYMDPKASPRDRAADLLGRMTLREKTGQLTQRLYGFACYERRGEDIRLTGGFYRGGGRLGGAGHGLRGRLGLGMNVGMAEEGFFRR